MREVSLLHQPLLRVWELKQDSTALESGRVKVSWGLMRSVQGFRDQCGQGKSLCLEPRRGARKQGGQGIHLPMGNSLYLYLELLCHKNKEQVNAVFPKFS